MYVFLISLVVFELLLKNRGALSLNVVMGFSSGDSYVITNFRAKMYGSFFVGNLILRIFNSESFLVSFEVFELLVKISGKHLC